MYVSIRIIKSRRMGWVGHVARMREKRTVYIRFEVFRAVTMKNGVFWDVTRNVGSYKSHTA
jgi:hypothetical protein